MVKKVKQKKNRVDEPRYSFDEVVQAAQISFKPVEEPSVPFSWHNFLFGEQDKHAKVSKRQVYEFSAGTVGLTFLITTFIITLLAGVSGFVWLFIVGLVGLLMEVYFWVFDTTRPADGVDAMVHTFVRKCWNFLLATLTVFTLGGAAILGKKLGGGIAALWRVYGEFISKILIVLLFWLAVLAGIFFVFWLFIKLNSLKYKKKPVEPEVKVEPPKLDDLNGGE